MSALSITLSSDLYRTHAAFADLFQDAVMDIWPFLS